MFPSVPWPGAAVGMGMLGLLEDAGATRGRGFRGPDQAQGMSGHWDVRRTHGEILGVFPERECSLGCA